MKSKRSKELLASLLSLVLVLSMIMGSMTNVSVAYATSAEAVSGSKTAAVFTTGADAGVGASIDYQLDVSSITQTTFEGKYTDIVFVIDTSGSMRDNSKLTNAKTAVTSLINQLLASPYNNYVKIGLVAYSDSVTSTTSLTNNAAALNTAVGNLSADGGTNIQAGLHTANTLFGSDSHNHIIILLSDGEPTYSYMGTSKSGSYITNFNYNFVLGSGSDYRLNYYNNMFDWCDDDYYIGSLHVTNNGLPTISEANIIKSSSKKTVIYTIGYGSLNSNATYVMNNVASTPSANYAFSSATSASAIKTIFDTIGQSITTSIGIVAPTLTDTVPAYLTITGNYSVKSGSTVYTQVSNKAALLTTPNSFYVTLSESGKTVTIEISEMSAGTYHVGYDVKLNVTADQLAALYSFDSVNGYFGGVKTDILNGTTPSPKFTYTLSGAAKTLNINSAAFNVPAYNYTITTGLEAYPAGYTGMTPTPSPVTPITGYEYQKDSKIFSVYNYNQFGYEDPSVKLGTEAMTENNGIYTLTGTAHVLSVDVYYALKNVTYSFTELGNTDLGDTKGNLGSGTVKYGTTITAPAIQYPAAVSGSYLIGTSFGPAGSWTEGQSIMLTSDVDYSATLDFGKEFYITYYVDIYHNGVKESSKLVNTETIQVVTGSALLADIPTVSAPSQYQDTDKYFVDDLGWSPDTDAEFGESTALTYTFDVYDYYTVNFYSDDSKNTRLYNYTKVKYGTVLDVPAGPDSFFTDVDGVHTVFTFAGWNPGPDSELNKYEITSDKDIYATYEETETYTVTFIDWDGTALKTITGVSSGDSVSAPSDPTRQPDGSFTYSFAGWDKSFDKITGPTTIQAQYTATRIYIPSTTYTVTYNLIDNSGDSLQLTVPTTYW